MGEYFHCHHLKMDRFKGKVAVVTGASCGIGECIAVELVKYGMQVVGLARRVEKVREIAKTLKREKGKLHAYKTDMSNESLIVDAIKWTTETLGPIHILINNAAVIEFTNLLEGDVEKWTNVFDVNVIGVLTATREVVQVMKAHGIDGHIVNINSITGHNVVYVPTINVYGASKWALRNLTEMTRMELVGTKSKIKISSVSPGCVRTPMLQGIEDHTEGFELDEMPLLNPEDVAQAIISVLDTPPHVQIYELIVKPLGETL